ncbi:hypothetical protein [Paenibacillus ferrarius]|uniref:hypothetical protein n=1 Tax=Paenibacillus ferrarius TaxID=1469647 RepID=UPI00117D30AB|nr:hypothetical protein [Paenibacillus ferrarius]
MKLLLDTYPFSKKPTGSEIPVLSNRISKYPVDITAAELAQEIVKGKTFVPVTLTEVGEKKRAQLNWKSQEIICLDFDNEKSIPDPDNPKKKIKVKDIKMTLAAALEEFKDTAMFIYTSFSHKPDHPKFRVVFALEKVCYSSNDIISTYNYFESKYPYIDTNCSEVARMFYGGKELFELNYSNRIPIVIASSINKSKNNGGGLCDFDSIRVLSNEYNSHQNPPSKVIINSNTQLNIQQDNMLEYIKSKNIDRLHTILNPNAVDFYTYSETVEHIKSQDLRLFLGINAPTFRCIFHDDNSPSASIFKSDKSNDILYCCNSSNCKFGTGNVIKCVEWLLKCNRLQALRFLRQVYKIGFHQTEWQKEQIEFLDENIRYVQSEEFSYSQPIQYKLIKNYIGDLVNFWSIAKDYLPPEHYSSEQSEVLFYASIGHFNKVYGKNKSVKRLGDRLSLFTYLKYIKKLKESEIPDRMLKESKKYIIKNKALNNQDSYNLIQHYVAYPLTQDVLVDAEDKALEYRNSEFTMKAWSWETIARTLNEEEANRVFPQMGGKKTKIREKSHKMTTEIEIVGMKLISENGWTTEKEILENVDLTIITSKTGKERQMKKIIFEFMQKYGLIKFQLNKKLSAELGIPPTVTENGVGYPRIIYKK